MNSKHTMDYLPTEMNCSTFSRDFRLFYTKTKDISSNEKYTFITKLFHLSGRSERYASIIGEMVWLTDIS